MNKIYLKLEQQPETLEELFDALFSYKCSAHIYKSVRTYEDAECQKIECYQNKYRSFDDIVTISKTYFPELTVKEIATTLVNRRPVKEGKTYHPYFLECLTIHKPTIAFFHTDRNSPLILGELESTELYNSEYKNWKTICDMVNFNTEQIKKR